jgi:hypothetical protein
MMIEILDLNNSPMQVVALHAANPGMRSFVANLSLRPGD